MHAERSAELKRRYGYDRWNVRDPGRARLFFRNYRVFDSAVPDWTMVSHRFVPLPTGMNLNRTVFRRPGDQDRALLLDTYECPSPEAAGEVLIDLLGNLQTPPSFYPVPGTTADVELAGSADAMIVQLVGNIVVSCQDAGQEPESARPVAAALLANLVETPPEVRAPHADAARPAPESLGEEAIVGQPYPLDLGPATRTVLERTVDTDSYLKLVVRNGDVRAQADQLVLTAWEAGEAALDVFVIEPRIIRMRRYVLGVRQP